MRLVIMAVSAAVLLVSAGCAKENIYQAPPVKGNEALINLDRIVVGIPSFFTIELDGKKIRFFVVKKPEGTEAYVDACEKCYYRKKGYVFREETVVCKDCNIAFDINDLKTGFGSCRPVPINGFVKENNFVISLDELKKGKRFF